MQAMCEREEAYLLRGNVQIDDAAHPIHGKLATVRTFSFAAIADWTQVALAKGCEVISDGLAWLRAVAEVGCIHQPVIVKGQHPNELPEFRWINMVLSNLKTNFNRTFHALRFNKGSDPAFGRIDHIDLDQWRVVSCKSPAPEP